MADTPGGFWSRQLGAYLSGKVQQAPSFLHPEVAQMVQEVSQQAMPAPVQPTPTPTPTPAPTPAPAAQAPKEPRIRLTGAQRKEIKYFNKENPGFEEYLKGFRPENQTLDAARQPALMDYLNRSSIPEVRQAAQNAFNPTLSLESPATVGLRTAQLGSPETMAYANRVALAGTTAGPQPAAPIQIEPLSQMKARDNVSALRDFQLKTDPRTMAAADRYPLAGTTAGTATAPEPAVDVAGRMNKGYVPKGFWEGATERVFQPEPGPPQGIDVNAPDFRAARGLGQAALGIARRRPMDVAIGVGAAGAGIKALYDEYGRQQAEQARPYTLAATLEAARQGRAEPSAAAQPLAAGNILAPVPGSALTTTGNAQRTIAEDMARRIGPEAPFLSSASGAPITFPTATAAAGAPSVAGRVTPGTGRPGTGRPGATPGQQRGELDLTGMSFSDAFRVAREAAQREGVDATGRFLWNGNAYQTNENPARGRERYVPESRQTRLGDLQAAPSAVLPPLGSRATPQTPVDVVTEPAGAAPPRPDSYGPLGRLSDFAERQRLVQAGLAEQRREGRGTRENPYVVEGLGAELSPDTHAWLAQHPEHRYASRNPNLQQEYVRLMQAFDRLGIKTEDIKETTTGTKSVETEGTTLKGSLPHLKFGKYGTSVVGGVFEAPSGRSTTTKTDQTQQRTGKEENVAKAYDLLADWNKRNEEWEKAQQAKEGLPAEKSRLELEEKRRVETSSRRLDELMRELRVLRSDARAKSDLAPLIRSLETEREDLEGRLKKD